MDLRDYQIETITRIHAAFGEGCRAVMCQMPTGTGKTVVLASIIREHLGNLLPEGGVLVVAHRREILDQTVETLKRCGLTGELEGGTVVVESIQKLAMAKEGADRTFSLVVIDEAHHAQARTYKMLWDWFPGARFLGMTATPCRMKKEGFTDLFDKLICTWDVKRFIMEGWLADYDYVAIRPDSDMKGRLEMLKKRGADGDYQVKEMGSIMDNRACIEQLYRSYRHFANGRQGIIYAINRTHAEHIRQYYEERGECVMLIDSSTPKRERERMMEEYRMGRIRIFVNCEIAGEGVDVPDVSFIQMARPSLSLSKYLQQVGRGLRPNKNKEKTVILDNVGMCYMFGLPNEERDWRTMFRGGQVVGSDNINLPLANDNPTDYDLEDMDKGHNLDMVLVQKDATAPEGRNKAYVTRKNPYEYVLMKNGRVVADNMFSSTTDFIDGVICLGSAYDGAFHFYDDNGTFLYKTEKWGELIPDLLWKIRDEGGGHTYLDLLTGIQYRSIPHFRYIGNACLIEKSDGWHLRNTDYDWVVADLDSIRTEGNITFVMDRDSRITYAVSGRTKFVYRLVGTEEDGSLLLVNDLKPSGVLVRKDGRLAFYQRNGQNEWLFRKWHRELTQPKIKALTATYS